MTRGETLRNFVGCRSGASRSSEVGGPDGSFSLSTNFDFALDGVRERARPSLESLDRALEGKSFLGVRRNEEMPSWLGLDRSLAKSSSFLFRFGVLLREAMDPAERSE